MVFKYCLYAIVIHILLINKSINLMKENSCLVNIWILFFSVVSITVTNTRYTLLSIYWMIMGIMQSYLEFLIIQGISLSWKKKILFYSCWIPCTWNFATSELSGCVTECLSTVEIKGPLGIRASLCSRLKGLLEAINSFLVTFEKMIYSRNVDT